MLSLVFCVLLSAYAFSPLFVPPEPQDYTVSLKVKAAMKYHGILFSTRDEFTKKSWFIRNGKKCTLFTSSFEERWAKR